jgi:site-specific DNA-methyltransferase (adenine-specific)
MNYHKMRNKELRSELKKRGLKGYSSLKKSQMIEYLSTEIHPLRNAVKQINYHQMRNKELREKLKERGLKGYSSLKKAQMIEYLSTRIHPLKNVQISATIAEGEIHNSSSEGIGYSPTIFGGTEELPVNQIVSGDCLKILRSFPDGVFDCCITDPPFNMSRKKGLGWAFSSHVTMQEQWDIFAGDDYFQFTVDWIREVLRVLKTNGNLFVFGSFHCIFTIGFILQSLFNRRIISQIVWYKPNAQPNITCRMFTESTEFIIWAVNNESKKAKNWTFNYEVMKAMNSDKQMRNMWEIPLTKRSEKKYGKHPSQKPLAVVNRLILAGTNEDDLILDPFSGTGTTAVVAKQNNRRWIMIEKEEAYNEIAHKRLDELSNMLFENDSENDW